ncbi:GNAT family N-acetyltransferase [Paraburkholderia nemoris]|uniref:GNAT family N-acetyltransferase n=1 Tax=Paraburkholderia nemoris TaxID=2793076 RepID=UPI0038BBE4EA
MFVKMLRRSGLLRPREETHCSREADVSYSEPIGSCDLFIIKGCGGRYGGEIGRIVAETFAPTDCCYVMDVLVDPQHRKRGIATKLLTRALQHSGRATLVPVSIERDAIAFWSRLAIKGELQVRLGLMHNEVQALRYAMRPIKL